MDWRIVFSDRAVKSIENNPRRKRIKHILSNFMDLLNEQGILAFKIAKVKKLKGKWLGYYRLRVGDIRIIFSVNFDKKEIFIYDVGFRGSVYR